MNCPVCLDKFTNPVVLPCGHTLCRDACAQRLIRKECLKCPTCRTVHWVPGGERGLPRNYALQEFMETPENNSETHSPHEDSPQCADHGPTRVSMFCTQCYQLVCLQCCLGPLNGPKPRHFQHEVVPVETAGEYMQSVVKSAAEYLQSRRNEEICRFENLSEANEQFQEMVKRGHSAIHKERKRLKRLLDDRSQLLIGQLHSLESSSGLSDQSQNSLERLLQYSLLAEQCEKIGVHRCGDSSREPVWKKCEDLGSLLQQIEKLPSGPEQPIPQDGLHRGLVRLNTEPLQRAIQSTLTLNIDPPSPPQFSLEDCVFGDTSVSISWTFQPEDKISYFTVYYETAIFVHGMCKDSQSFDVTDFGRVSGQTTIRGLTRGNRYRVFVVARNEVGVSKNSAYLYFRANAGDSDVKLV